MNIALRKIRYAAHASEETHCFSADVYIDGKKVGTARNAGHGGPTDIDPRALCQKLDAYGATLPPIVSSIPDNKDPSKFFTYSQSGETLIHDLLEDHLLEREIKRKMTTRILYTVPGKRGIFQTRTGKAAQVQRWLTDPALATKLKSDKVLNLLPLAEAIALCKASER